MAGGSSERAAVRTRIFYNIPVILGSPVSISSGEEEYTDHDILTNDDGNAVIPGTTIAGAFLSYIKKKNGIYTIFGNDENNDSNMSRLFFSDIILDNGHITKRDGIKLTEDKITENTGKYDYHIIERGVSGCLKIECVIYDRDEYTAEDVDNTVLDALNALDAGVVRLGFKKNRGLGRIRTADKYEYQCFDYSEGDKKSIAEKYIDFCCSPFYEKRTFDKTFDIPENTAVIRLPLKLTGGISIRTYSARPNEADFRHITTGTGRNEKAVIPGSSWNGAVRARVFDILKNDLRADDRLIRELEYIWGYEDSSKYHSSAVCFFESEINGSHSARMTRNKINRFDASASDGALYTETAYFKGDTCLEIRVSDIPENLWAVKLIMFALKDICGGYLSIGGQTSIGRGIFSSEKGMELINFTEQECTQALRDKLKENEAQQ